MKHLYKEQNTFRILPINFMHNLGILLKYDAPVEDVYLITIAYYEWAMGHALDKRGGEEVLKAFILLGDKMNLTDYEARLEVWNKHNGQ